MPKSRGLNYRVQVWYPGDLLDSCIPSARSTHAIAVETFAFTLFQTLANLERDRRRAWHGIQIPLGEMPLDGWEIIAASYLLLSSNHFQPLSLRDTHSLILLSGALFYSEAFIPTFTPLRTTFCATFAVHSFDSFSHITSPQPNAAKRSQTQPDH